MSDPNSIDPLAIGGGGLAGAGVVAGIVRLIFGGALADLKEKLADLKAEVKEALVEQRADTREQLSSLKEMLSTTNERHDKAIGEIALQGQKVSALHQRLDVIEHGFREIERRLDRIEGDR